MEINTKEELMNVITDLQGQMANMQETIDKLSPVDDNPKDDDPKDDDPKDDLSDDEINEIDKLLQED